MRMAMHCKMSLSNDHVVLQEFSFSSIHVTFRWLHFSNGHVGSRVGFWFASVDKVHSLFLALGVNLLNLGLGIYLCMSRESSHMSRDHFLLALFSGKVTNFVVLICIPISNTYFQSTMSYYTLSDIFRHFNTCFILYDKKKIELMFEIDVIVFRISAAT